MVIIGARKRIIVLAEETACLEEATNEAYRLYCEAAQFIIEDNPEFMERALNIPKEIGERIRASWDADELSLYGRFDFILAKDGTPKILEFNADTPTSLLEASVMAMERGCFSECDQFNGIHEGLVQSWKIFSPKKERFILLVH